jgi:hypothetical protein
MPARQIDQALHQTLAVAAAVLFRGHCHIQHVCFVGGYRQHPVAYEGVLALHHPALVAGFDAIAEDAHGPREFVGAQLDGDDGFEIFAAHGAQLRIGLLDHGDHALSSAPAPAAAA